MRALPWLRRSIVLMSLLFSAAGLAPAYYHYLRYLNRNALGSPTPERFDLAALPARAVPFFINDLGPNQYHVNDSYAGTVSQLRAAAKAWNDVETSDLRLTYGGLISGLTPQTSPGIEVVFDDVPPGLVALGGPTVKADPASGPNGTFTPIVRSVIVLRKDQTARPSFSEAFFLTAVHEFGHCIGLQHSMASSVMSTEITRGTSKARPLSADDVAAVSWLYPNKSFTEKFGSISGRVAMGSSPAALASVVAMSPNGPAVGVLTHPDGTYQIDGLAPGIYYLYVHPLPPALEGESSPANISLPLDSRGQSYPATGPFETMFYPGVKEATDAVTITVAAGTVSGGHDFQVRSRGPLQLFQVQTYGFQGQVAVKPPFLLLGESSPFLVAAGYGVTSRGGPNPGLQASVVGGAATIPGNGLKAYAGSADYIRMDVQLNPFAGEGQRHVVFKLQGDNYVLPNAFTVVQRSAPAITNVAPTPDNTRALTLAGKNLTPDTRFLFDGLPAGVQTVNDAGTSATVIPPPGLGSKASVVALNNDGQSSLFSSPVPVQWNYDSPGVSTYSLNPSFLAAGTDSMVEITGVNTLFVDGSTQLGFGSADVWVRRVWVISPTRLLANVSIVPNAGLASVQSTVTTGLQVLNQPFGFQIQAANPRQLSISSQVVNAGNGQPSVPVGGSGIVTLLTTPNSANNNLAVTLNGDRVPVLFAGGNQVTFQVPGSVAPGPAILRLQVGGDQSAPVVVQIEPAPNGLP